MYATVTVSNAANVSPLTVKILTKNGDPTGQEAVSVAASGNTIVTINENQKIVVTLTQ